MYSQGKICFCILVFMLLASAMMFVGCASMGHSAPGPSPGPTPIASGPMPTPTPTSGAPAPTPTPTPPGGPTPTPTPNPPGGPTPTPTPAPTPSPSPTPTPTPSSSNSITGRVTDINGAPIVGKVQVALEAPLGDFRAVMVDTADAQGNFLFPRVPPLSSFNSYALVISARAAHDPGTAPGTPGSFYAPAILVSGQGSFGPGGDPIVPGTDVGTIALHFTSQGDIQGSVTSTDSTHAIPVPIQVQFAMLRTFQADFFFDYPLPDGGPMAISTAPGPGCPAGTACASFTVTPIPTSPVEFAVFSKSGYSFSPFPTGPNFALPLNAVSLITDQPDCNPSSLQLEANSLQPDQANQAGTATFQGCQ